MPPGPKTCSVIMFKKEAPPPPLTPTLPASLGPACEWPPPREAEHLLQLRGPAPSLPLGPALLSPASVPASRPAFLEGRPGWAPRGGPCHRTERPRQRHRVAGEGHGGRLGPSTAAALGCGRG